jgi:hypothetical protein
MNKYINITFFVATLFGFLSCTQEDDAIIENISDNANKDIILLDHAANLPLVKTWHIIRKTRAIGDNGEIIGNSDAILGYSYDVGNSILGDYSNVKYQVVDIEKVKEIGNTYVTPLLLNNATTQSYSYNGMSKYEANTCVTKKVASGFSLNVGLFKIGRQKKTTEVFKTAVSDNNNAVFGELNLLLNNSSFTLSCTSGNRKLFSRQCLSNSFLRDLYTSTTQDVLTNYGQFVLTGYITGGKAFALFAGIGNENSSSESKEKDMNDDISASFSWKSGNSTNLTSGSLGFGKGNSSYSSYQYKTKNIQMSIQTFGGNTTTQAFVGPAEMDNLSIDMTSWWNSLNDVNKHTIIDIKDGGLYPLSAFVLEKNFKNRLDDTTNKYLEGRNDFIQPYIEIVKTLARIVDVEPLYEVSAVLNTRHGDKIILSNGQYVTESDALLRANNERNVYDAKVSSILANKRQYFVGLQYRKNYSTKYDPSIRVPLCIRLDGFDESSMYKYENTKNGMVYIYNPQKRIAISYYTDDVDGDWILDEYGIRDWIETVPSRSISLATLSNYTIVGL